jgi:hypothetical protein
MAGTDKVDTHGHTKDIAVGQEPTLDVAADPASLSVGNGDPLDGDMVLAQSTAEVTAQIENPVAGSGD